MRVRRKNGTFTSAFSAKRNFRHGHAFRGKISREYEAFRNAKNRCRRKQNSDYSNYGGRGIKFLFKSFHEFLAEVGPKPSSKRRLDRIDNDGHYEPGNVRWATYSQSAKNARMTQGRLRHLKKIHALAVRDAKTGQFIGSRH
jgi:hypothetical protein